MSWNGAFVEGVTEENHLRLGDWLGAARFADAREEYDAACGGAAVCDRSYRGLLEIRGNDRAEWLGNLATNHIKNLLCGDGNYAYFTSVKGRIVLDANVLVREDAIWLDVDRRFIARAIAHFEKFVIVEDVAIADRTDELARIGLCGPGAGAVLKGMGASNASASAQLQRLSVAVGDGTYDAFRHDFAGVFGVEMVVPVDAAANVWNAMLQRGATPVGFHAIDVLRIEAGIPWPMSEINDDILPAETDQLARAVSFNKGCYLGQEVVERMRSRGALARKLVTLRCDEGAVPRAGATLLANEREVGSVTSACASPRFERPIAMGYARTGNCEADSVLTIAWDDKRAEAVVMERPTTH